VSGIGGARGKWGRRRARRGGAEVALFTSVFAVGLILMLGQGLKDQYAKPGNAWNATLGVVDSADYATVAPQLAHTAGVTRHETFRLTGSKPVAINGATVKRRRDGGLRSRAQAASRAARHHPRPRAHAPDQTAGTGNVMRGGNLDPALHVALGDRITVQFMAKFMGYRRTASADAHRRRLHRQPVFAGGGQSAGRRAVLARLAGDKASTASRCTSIRRAPTPS
jgi:hypothetical protein